MMRKAMKQGQIVSSYVTQQQRVGMSIHSPCYPVEQPVSSKVLWMLSVMFAEAASKEEKRVAEHCSGERPSEFER